MEKLTRNLPQRASGNNRKLSLYYIEMAEGLPSLVCSILKHDWELELDLDDLVGNPVQDLRLDTITKRMKYKCRRCLQQGVLSASRGGIVCID